MKSSVKKKKDLKDLEKNLKYLNGYKYIIINGKVTKVPKHEKEIN